MKKTFWMVTIIVLLLMVNIVLISAFVSKVKEPDKTGYYSALSSSSTDQMLSASVDNQVFVSGNVIKVAGNTNLPDGTIVKHNLWYVDKYGIKSNLEKNVAVEQGQINAQFEIDAKVSPQKMTLNTEVFFNTNEQPGQVTAILGKTGEFLRGSAVQSLGGYNALLFQDEFAYPDEQTVIASITPEDQIRAAIAKSVDGLKGIEIYQRNKHYAVEAVYDLEDGFGLESAAKKVARDFTSAAYATGLPILRTSIIINKPDGILGLNVTVGNKQASTQPATTWTNSSIGPSIFIEWVIENSNDDYKNIENHTTIKNNF